MLRQAITVCACAVMLAATAWTSPVSAQDDQVAVNNNPLPSQIPSAGFPAVGNQAFGRQWAGTYSTQDWDRFYHYPYVYYPQNFWGDEYYRSSESLYYRYPAEMRIPVYNRQWHNMYPEGAQWDKYYSHRYHRPPGGGKYHQGHHFILDTF
ncbi:MAG: calmodulin-binding protein [Planctomycetota bacterium]|nr:calmodulin-binding protein [Planctomycetota bacterium]